MQDIYIEQELLDQIDAFCALAGISAAEFGTRAANDRSLVYSMRRGREVRHKTRTKIRSFIIENAPKAPRNASPTIQGPTGGAA